MRRKRIGVVGGGPGGLMLSYRLQWAVSEPVEIEIFEASNRLGGKVLTPRFEHSGVQYEAGAAEFYDYSQFGEDGLKELVEELGLRIQPMGGSAVIQNGQVIETVDDVRHYFGDEAYRDWVRFDRVAKDWITPNEFYESDDPEGVLYASEEPRFSTITKAIQSEQTRGYLETMIHSDLATEPERTSCKYGLHNYLMNDAAYMGLYCIDGGNEQLVTSLASRVSAKIHLHSPVEMISKGEANSLRVTCRRSGEEVHREFDYVVIALPHNALGALSYGTPRLAQAMRAHHAHYDFPAHYLRVTLLFDYPFWRTQLRDSFWMLDRFGGCCLYDESLRQVDCSYGVLGWLLAGDDAERMNHLSDEALVDAALDSLPESLSEGRRLLKESRVHRWISAVNAMPGGTVMKPLDQRHQPEPVEHKNLFVVGDYLFDSTLNGVLDSADYVADWIAAEVAK